MKAFFLLYVLFGYLYLGANPAHAGGIYKWLDQHGVTHYSDQPSKQHHSLKLGRQTIFPIFISTSRRRIFPGRKVPPPGLKADVSADAVPSRTAIASRQKSARSRPPCGRAIPSQRAPG